MGRVRTINSELNGASSASEAATDKILGTILENKVHSVLCSKIIRTENSNKFFDAYAVIFFWLSWAIGQYTWVLTQQNIVRAMEILLDKLLSKKNWPNYAQDP